MRTVDRAVEGAAYAIGIVLLLAVAINFANVIGRYVFSRPLIWGEEIMIYLTIWTVFIGIAVAAWRNNHLRMDVVYDILPPRWKRATAILIQFVTLCLCGTMLLVAWRVISLLQTNNIRSNAAGVPVFVVYWAIPVGFGLAGLIAAVYLVGYVLGTRRAETERSVIEEELEREGLLDEVRR